MEASHKTHRPHIKVGKKWEKMKKKKNLNSCFRFRAVEIFVLFAPFDNHCMQRFQKYYRMRNLGNNPAFDKYVV